MTNQTSQLIAPPGLKNLVVADTKVGSVQGDRGFFHYRHLDAVTVARHNTFEAATHLLIDGSIPDAATESMVRADLASSRRLDPFIRSAVELAATSGRSAMAILTSVLAVALDDRATIDLTPDERRRCALVAIGLVPSIVAGTYRLNEGLDIIDADPSLGHAADFVRMLTGVTPTPRHSRAVETYLLLTLDHGFNASTFASRVITSTGASVGASITGAIGALSGPLHGGAPSRVLDMIETIGEPGNTEAWAKSELAAGNKLMGFGHAVYRADDPRSLLLREMALGLGGPLVDKAIEIEERMLHMLRAWKPEATIVTNVEFYAAVVLHLAGIPQDMFSATFATSRVVGWAAHILEQSAENKIMRPSARYVGPAVAS